MSLITEWVMQVIVFILLGTIVELLIPNNTMKKYVNIVIGLLLLLILTKPILYLFSIDINSQLERVELAIFQDDNTLAETESLVEKQKKDIQAEQDAYIWNEVKLQLIQEANPILIEQYAVQITDVSFALDDQDVDKYDNLKQVIVTLQRDPGEDGKENQEEMIKPIIIETDEQKEVPKNNGKSEPNIRKTLGEIWGLNKEQIQIMWEGGTS